jgi:hypothetical protein
LENNSRQPILSEIGRATALKKHQITLSHGVMERGVVADDVDDE